MTRRALVFLIRGTEREKYIGAKLIDPAPIPGGRVAFMHDGHRMGGRVGSILPTSWTNDSELIPTLRIIGE